MLRYPTDSPYGRAFFTPGSVLLFGLGMLLLVQQVALPLLLTQALHALTGTDLRAVMMGEAELGYAEADLIRAYYLLSQVLGFGLLSWVLARAAGSVRAELRLRHPATAWAWLLGLATLLAAIPVLQLVAIDPRTFSLPAGMEQLAETLKDLEAKAEHLQRGILQDQLGYGLIVMALAPAIMEELFFRGFLQSTLRRMMNVHLAIWLGAFIFSFIHFQVFGFFFRMGLGVLFGYLVYYSGSLWPAVVGHFANNALGVLLVYGAAHWGWSAAIAEDNYELPPATIAGGAVALLSLLWLYIRLCRARQWPPAALPTTSGDILHRPSEGIYMYGVDHQPDRVEEIPQTKPEEVPPTAPEPPLQLPPEAPAPGTPEVPTEHPTELPHMPDTPDTPDTGDTTSTTSPQ